MEKLGTSETNTLRVLEDRVLRRIFGPRRHEVTGKRRKQRNNELHALFSSITVFRVIKSRRLRQAEREVPMGTGEMHTEFWWRNLREGRHLEDSGADERIILKWIFEK
jgi:hypothetical protein